ncbi:MAG: TIGR02281 family clan AA aspartic protease [Rhodobacteraceae bacterium]|nr:TIGR02281 family clan AA aspartic protease [Paracoccaceae bacterium]MCB1369203.1 TIGR02281 family clan AA aspartic protease [Paracoccaceae bacterium]
MDGWQFGNLVYLILLMLMVAGWFFAQNRQSLNRTLQQAILWAFLFAGVVLLYGMKDQLRLQVMPQASVQSEADNVITLRRAADRHFYASLNINGQNVVFVVDTGATHMVLSRQDAVLAGIDPDDLVYLGTAETANGTVRTAPVRLDEVRFGGQTDRNVQAWVNDSEMSGSLLGMSYLSRFARIEIAGDAMRLSR